ncbi:MAG: LysM peptidoglycan-binding domain-containing protein [Caldilineales bacterium]|nr:LysM peptidoglycan-binding domain-containing protein [Caldilineales bacterium]
MPRFRLANGRRVTVHDGFIIGRSASCHLRLDDPAVAPRHLIVQDAGDYWQVATLSLSASGSWNGRPLPGLVRLRPGDVLQLGNTRLVWEGETAGLLARFGWKGLALIGLVLLIAVLALLAVWFQALQAGPSLSLMLSTATLTAVPTLAVEATPGHATDPSASSTTTSTPELPPTQAVVVPTPFTVWTPTPAPSPTPTITATPVSSACPPPAGWVPIIVGRGETLRLLARRYGVQPAQLRRANCLPDNRIRPGQELFVPASPP